MKNKFLNTVLLLFVSAISFAQSPTWSWANSSGSISNDYSNATCSDANGNVYITGTFQGASITFGNYTLHNAATGKLDIFIVKYDANGNVLWAKSGSGIQDDYSYGISSDVNGNIYIAGYFNSQAIQFGSLTLINDTSNNSSDIFITKYDSSGTELWAKRGGGKSDEESRAICTDANNNVYITGSFYSSDFILGDDTIHRGSGTSCFVAKFDFNGNIVWARAARGYQVYGYGVCADANENVYVTGFYEYFIIFGSDTFPGTNSGNMFVIKYDMFGNKIWAKAASGNLSVGTGVSIFDGNSIYVSGFFQYLVIINDTIGNAGTHSIFLAKYDSSGNALWARNPGGTGYDYGSGTCTDSSGHVFITGYYASSFLTFGNNHLNNFQIGYDDMFIAKYDSNGNAMWATSVGGPDNEYSMGLCSSGNNVFVTGYFGSPTLEFGNTNLTNNGSNDIFLAKLSSVVGIDEYYSDINQFYIYPNPSEGEFNIYSPHFSLQTIDVFSLMGQKVYSEKIFGESEKKINLNNFEEGIYFVRISGEEKSFCRKIIVEHN